MENNDLQAILELREYLIFEYKKLGTGANSSFQQTETKNVAVILEKAVQSLDEVLSSSGKVNFE